MKIYDRMLKINKLGPFCKSFRGLRFGFWAFLRICCVLGMVFVVGCRNQSDGPNGNSSVVKCDGTVQFESSGSEYFSIGKLCGVDVAVVRSVVGKDTLVHKYVMMDSAAAGLGTDLHRRGFPEEWQSAFVLRVPLKRVVDGETLEG